MTTLSILDSSGDHTITWDDSDEADREKARQEVEHLARAGYSFFLADGTPADAIAAGRGTLIVKRLTSEEVAGKAPPQPVGEAPDPPADPPRKRRGRPRKAESPDRHVIAVRPLAGG